MKAVLAIAVALVAIASARADWKDLKKGMDHTAILQCVGAPMQANRGHGGAFEVWTYDAGGFVMLEGGRVTYWQPSKAVPAIVAPAIVFHVPAPTVQSVTKVAPNALAKN